MGEPVDLDRFEALLKQATKTEDDCQYYAMSGSFYNTQEAADLLAETMRVGPALIRAARLATPPDAVSATPASEGVRKLARDLYADAVSGLRYIEQHHGRLPGVGWDRVFDAFDDNVTIPEREGLLAFHRATPTPVTSHANSDGGKSGRQGSDDALREENVRLRAALQTAVDAIALYLQPSAMDGGIGECAAIVNAQHADRTARAALAGPSETTAGER